MSLKEISSNDLRQLKELYKVEWPLHIMTYNLLKNFAGRFEKDRKLREKVNFWSLDGNWRDHGTFVMTFGSMICFNTLESAPYAGITEALMLLSYRELTTFMDVRDIFRPLISDVTTKLNLKIVADIPEKCNIAPKEIFQGVAVT